MALLTPSEVAQILIANMPLIRRRLRRKLKGGPTSADLDDLCSSVIRRVYTAALHSLRASADQEVIAYATIVADHLAQRRQAEEQRYDAVLRVIARQTGGSAFSDQSERQSAPCLQRLAELLADPVDRDLLLRRQCGHSYTLIAEETGVTEAALRKRWSRLRAFLKRCLGDCPPP